MTIKEIMMGHLIDAIKRVQADMEQTNSLKEYIRLEGRAEAFTEAYNWVNVNVNVVPAPVPAEEEKAEEVKGEAEVPKDVATPKAKK